MPAIKQINALLLIVFSKVTYSTCFKKNAKTLLQSSQIVILVTKKKKKRSLHLQNFDISSEKINQTIRQPLYRAHK